jgi:plastocyanin
MITAMRAQSVIGIAAGLWALVAGGSLAADLTVSVRTASGKPVADAVVMAYPQAGGAARPSGAYRVSQHNLMFDPFVLVAPVGAEVSFPNLDPVRHHVYSFSPTKPFELKLYAKGEAPSVKMDKAGVVALGCNIHDSMVAFIRVVDTPWAAKTDAQGRATLRDIPGGMASLRVWHPYSKAKGGETARAVNLARDGAVSEAFTLDLRPAPEMKHY